MRNQRQIGKAALSAICALTLICALAPSAGALPDSAGSTTTDQPATTNKTATASPVPKSTAPSGTPSGSSSKPHTASSRKRSARKKTARVRGQQKIDPERAQAIQQALIRQHYLTGTPTGEWNEASEAAMRRYQEDNGWQTVVVPDSRALIKLGLGPSKDHLLNPESAMTTVPDAPKAQPASPAPPTAPVVANPAPHAAAPTTPLENTTSSPQ
jgi:hypothetical protein